MKLISPADAKRQLLREQMQREASPRHGSEGESVLQPFLVDLAEFRAIGYPWTFVHEFVRRCDVTVSFSQLYSWSVKRIGNASGPGSQAAKIVEAAVAEGGFSSAFVVNGVFMAGSSKGNPNSGANTGSSKQDRKKKASVLVVSSVDALPVTPSATTYSLPPLATPVEPLSDQAPTADSMALAGVSSVDPLRVSSEDAAAQEKAATKADLLSRMEAHMRQGEANDPSNIAARVLAEPTHDEHGS